MANSEILAVQNSLPPHPYYSINLCRTHEKLYDLFFVEISSFSREIFFIMSKVFDARSRQCDDSMGSFSYEHVDTPQNRILHTTPLETHLQRTTALKTSVLKYVVRRMWVSNMVVCWRWAPMMAAVILNMGRKF